MTNQTRVPAETLSNADLYAAKLLAQGTPQVFDVQGKQQTCPYCRVIVLLLTWTDADHEALNLEMFRNLEEVYLDQYKFDILLYRIPTHNPQEETEEVFEKYRHYSDDPSNLLIVHYYGHGGVHNKADLKTDNRHKKHILEAPVNEEKSLRLILSAWNLNGKVKAQIITSPTLDWSRINSNLQKMKSDVIVWMDSCDSAGAFRPTDSQGLSGHRMEIVSACGYPGKTQNARLGHFLIQELISKAKEAEVKPFTMASLYRSILGKYMQKNSEDPDVHEIKALVSCLTLVYINMSNELGSTSILVMSFKKDIGVHAIPLQHFLVDLPGIRKSGN